jgi:O-antigen/teichoic acid export membrane protein
LAGFGTASLLSGFALNSTEAVIRGHLISGASVAENGIYQAALSLSTQVTTVIVGGVGAYSLATLSQVKDAKDISSGMEQLLHVVLPLSTLSLGFVGILGRPLFSSLFSSQFLEGTKFLPLLLTANYVQTAAWVTGAPLLGRALLRTWLVIQLIGVSIRYAAVDLWFPMIGSYAVPAALLAAWGFDLMANLLVCKWVIRAGLQLSTLLTFCAGAGVVAAAAVLGTTTTHFGTCLLGAAVLCCIAGLMSWSETAAGLRKLLPWTPQ